MIIILGPTATGKTKLASQIAKRNSGEIISADSRQVYKYLNIGTGKDLEEYQFGKIKIPYHLIDIIELETDYSVYTFQKDFIKSYKQIIKGKKIPILCGGTGLYIESVLLDYDLSNSPPPNYSLRQKLNKKNTPELIEYFNQLNKNIIKNPKMDTKNRIIRNIEICLNNSNKKINNKKQSIIPIKKYQVIGINPGRDKIRQNITQRLDDRLQNGLIEEVEGLLNNGITHERLNYFGLEYRFISRYIKGAYKKDDLFEKLNSAIHQFSKKQMTFFRRMEKRNIKIHWIEKPNINHIEKII